MNSLTPSEQSSSPGFNLPPAALPTVPDHELLRRIGRGAYGEVWLARSVTGAFRAVKIVSRTAFDHDRPFEREFQGILKFEPISRLHDSQIDILHVGRGDNLFYYVMELADDQADGGQIHPDSYNPRTLKSELFLHGRMPFEDCLRIGVALATALEHLHGKGLVHRDVKPSNIIFVNGVAKLADIGLVAAADATRSYVGTEGFAAPEGAGTPQADIYSLGKVLYELSTGRDRQDFPELPTDLRELPDREGLRELNAVIGKACRHDPKDRYSSAAEMRADLELLQSGKSLAKLRRTERRLLLAQRLGMIFTGISILVGAGWYFQARQTRELSNLAEQKTRLLREKTSLANEKTGLAEASRKRLVQVHTANGIRAMDEGDFPTAALWLSEAYKLSDSEAREVQRYRLGTLFRHTPKPEAILAFRGDWKQAWATPDGKAIVGVASTPVTNNVWNHRITFWDPDTYNVADSLEITNSGPIQVSRSGQWAVVKASGEFPDLWDLRNQKLIRRLSSEACDRMEFSPEGSCVALSTGNGTNVTVYQIPSGALSFGPIPHPTSVTCMRFDFKGAALLTSCEVVSNVMTFGTNSVAQRFAKARVWRTSDGQPLTDWIDCSDPVTDSSFSPDGRAIALFGAHMFGALSSLVPHEVPLYDVRTGRPRFPALSHGDSVLSGAFSPDSRYLATSSADRLVNVWNAYTGEPVWKALRHKNSLSNLAFSPDNRVLVVAGEREIRSWDMRSGSQLGTTIPQGRVFSLSFVPDSRRLITLTDFGRITVWPMNEAEPGLPPCQTRTMTASSGVAFSPDGSRLAVFSPAGDLELWDRNAAPTSPVMGIDRDLPVTQGYLYLKGSWSPNGKLFAVPTGDRTACIFDCVTGKMSVPVLRHDKLVLACEFSPDGTKVVTASEDGTARVWNTATGNEVPPALQHSDMLCWARFTPDGKRIITSGEHGLAAWDAVTHQKAQPSFKVGGVALDFEFSPDGTRLAAITRGHFIEVYDLSTGERVGKEMDTKVTATRFRYSPDGRRLVSASLNRTAQVWDAATGLPIGPALAHDGYVLDCCFSPDGERVVTASYDMSVRVWCAATGEPLSPPLPYSSGVLSASFSPDGAQVAGADLNGCTQLWNVAPINWTPDEVSAAAHVISGVRLGEAERLEQLNTLQLSNAWQIASALFQSERANSNASLLWHKRRLAQAESNRDHFGCEYHARQWLAKCPEDPFATAALARVLRVKIPPRDPVAPKQLIDLSDFYNASLAEPWHQSQPGSHFGELPQGIQTLAGTPFDVRGIVQVYGVSDPIPWSYPKAISGMPVRLKAGKLHFLQSIQGASQPTGTHVGHYVIHFAGGRSIELPVSYNEDASDWWDLPGLPTETLRAGVAWCGESEASRRHKMHIRLFKRTWENPWPDIEIASIDFIGSHPRAYPFLVALTAE